MRARWSEFIDWARSSFWYLPSIMMIAGILLFAMNQVAEMAVRALSPALNNPFTAVDCVNRIGHSLAMFMQCPLPREALYDEHEQLRLTFRLPNFAELLDSAFVPIRNYGRTSTITLQAMLRVVEGLVPLTQRRYEREALARHAESICAAADHGLPERVDLERIQAQFARVQQALD